MDLVAHRATLANLSARYLDEDASKLIQRLARPAIRLSHSAAANGSHVGGAAKLTPDTPWPEWNGRPLSLLALLDLSEIHHLEADIELPSAGLLNFFYESEEQEAWGFDPAHEEGWRVILSDPAEATECRSPEGATTFQHISLSPSQTLTIPGWEEDAVSLIHPAWDSHPFGSPQYEADDQTRSQFTNLSEAWADITDSKSVPNHRIGGWPRLQQAPIWEECQFTSNGIRIGRADRTDPKIVELAAGVDDWRLLFQLDTDEEAGWMWGDVGTLFFTVNSSRFTRDSRPWMTLQCG